MFSGIVCIYAGGGPHDPPALGSIFVVGAQVFQTWCKNSRRWGSHIVNWYKAYGHPGKEKPLDCIRFISVY